MIFVLYRDEIVFLENIIYCRAAISPIFAEASKIWGPYYAGKERKTTQKAKKINITRGSRGDLRKQCATLKHLNAAWAMKF